MRITYLGELGYELYVPTEQAVHVYDRLVAAGAASGCGTPGSRRWRACGWRRATATTATTSTTPTRVLEAGLGFAVALDKPGGFVGREAVLAKKAAGPLHPAAGPGAGARPGAAAVPRRGRPPRRHARRLRPRRVVRLHARRCGRAGHGRGRRADRPGLPGPAASGRSTSRDSATRRWLAAPACTTRRTSAS